MGIAVVGTIGLAAPAAGDQSDRSAAPPYRESVSLGFDEQRVSTISGGPFAVDYVNPDAPNAKPPAVAKVVIRYPEGTTIDTSVPARCEAPNAQLIASGASACPTASKVGVGELDLDTGIEGPGRILRNNVTLLNNKDELILLLEDKSDSSRRIVTRVAIQGTTLTSEVTAVPGGPPDGFTAIKRVRLRVDPYATGSGNRRRGYLVTPPSCPSSGYWTSVVSFTYRDGKTETLASPSPCRGTPGNGSSGNGGGARDGSPPRISVAGVRRSGCAGRDFRARVRIRERGSGLRQARLSLNGTRLMVTRRAQFSRRIRATRLRRSRHRLRVVALDKAGNRATKTVHFRTCGR